MGKPSPGPLPRAAHSPRTGCGPRRYDGLLPPATTYISHRAAAVPSQLARRLVRGHLADEAGRCSSAPPPCVQRAPRRRVGRFADEFPGARTCAAGVVRGCRS